MAAGGWPLLGAAAPLAATQELSFVQLSVRNSQTSAFSKVLSADVCMAVEAAFAAQEVPTAEDELAHFVCMLLACRGATGAQVLHLRLQHAASPLQLVAREQTRMHAGRSAVAAATPRERLRQSAREGAAGDTAQGAAGPARAPQARVQRVVGGSCQV